MGMGNLVAGLRRFSFEGLFLGHGGHSLKSGKLSLDDSQKDGYASRTCSWVQPNGFRNRSEIGCCRWVNPSRPPDETMKKIDLTKNMAQLIHENPSIARVLARYEIDCAQCLASQVDTLPDVVRMYKLDLNQLLAQISTEYASTKTG